MVASISTIQKVMQIVRSHVSDETFRKILMELKEVPGNKSFRDTIAIMAEMFERKTE